MNMFSRIRRIRIGGQLSKSLYQFTLQGADVKELYQAAPQLEGRMWAVPDSRT